MTKTTVVTKEYDAEGRLVKETTTTTENTSTGYVQPNYYYPYWQQTYTVKPGGYLAGGS